MEVVMQQQQQHQQVDHLVESMDRQIDGWLDRFGS